MSRRPPTIMEQLRRLAMWIEGCRQYATMVLWALERERFPERRHRRYSLESRIARLQVLASVCLDIGYDGGRINAAAFRNLRITATSNLSVLQEDVLHLEKEGVTEHLTAEGLALFEQEEREHKARVDALLVRARASGELSAPSEVAADEGGSS